MPISSPGYEVRGLSIALALLFFSCTPQAAYRINPDSNFLVMLSGPGHGYNGAVNRIYGIRVIEAREPYAPATVVSYKLSVERDDGQVYSAHTSGATLCQSSIQFLWTSLAPDDIVHIGEIKVEFAGRRLCIGGRSFVHR